MSRKTEKLPTNVKVMLERADAMEREACLLRHLAKAEAKLASYRLRDAARARSEKRRRERAFNTTPNSN